MRPRPSAAVQSALMRQHKQPSAVSSLVKWFLIGCVLALASQVFRLIAADLFPGSYHGVGSDPEDAFFSANYWVARQRFRHEARAVGAELTTLVVHTDPHSGIEYTMDVAVLRGSQSSSADTIVMHTSGVHGAEGFAGSAIQIAALHRFRGAASPPVTTVFVHAVNPYGFAELRRFNENNVDLNRNGLSEEEFKGALQRHPNLAGYEDVRFALETTSVSWHSPITVLFSAAFALMRYGFDSVKKAIVSGQYHSPRGVYYGGTALQPSHVVLAEFLKPMFDTKRVLCIDVHSGLGPSGVDTLMVSDEDIVVVKRHFGKTAFSVESPQSSQGGASGGYELSIGTDTASHKFSKASHVVSITQEFGTRPGVIVARAVILENAAHHLAFGSDHHVRMKQHLKNAFYVQTSAWKSSVLARGAKVLEEAYEMATAASWS